jgi:methylated-DNA-protein-cysteine methyltransferase-like protein
MVSRIPIGHVATYGQIAKLIGYPRHARQVGFALAALENGSSVPWHRVINTKGKISPRGLDGCDDYQRLLLEEENVIFSNNDCISLKQFQWQPDSLELSNDN